MLQFVRSNWRSLTILTALTLGVYLGTFKNDFVDYDDDRFVTQNLAVLHGLSWSGVVYAFTTFDTGTWIPLTWLSLQLDSTLFGLNASGFHGTGLLLHLANVALFYAFLRRVGVSDLVALFAALVFGIHPLHVESVAWVSERKDVLSTFFLLLTLLAYVHYSKRPDLNRYWGVLGLLVLGLLSKPMLVTLPALMLVLDLWVLNRCDGFRESGLLHHSSRASLWRLSLEKVPMFMIVGLFAVVTILAQKSDLAVMDLAHHSFLARACNALCSYAWYLNKTILPWNLCAFYPLEHGQIDGPATLWSLSLLISISAGVWIWAREKPYLIVGWLWYLISLVPVIGLFQVGGQAHADRFTYVPHLGLFWALTLLAADLTSSLKFARPVRMGIAAVIVAVCGVSTLYQVSTWRDTQSLWSHADRIQTANWMAKFYLGLDHLRQRNVDEARDYAKQSLDICPHNTDALALLGKTYLNEERWDYAAIPFQTALEINPFHRDSLIGMAAVSHGNRRFRDAENYLVYSLEKRPSDPYVRIQLGSLYAQIGRETAAFEQFAAAIKANPRYTLAWKMMGQLQARAGQHEDALQSYLTAIRLSSEDPECFSCVAKLYRSLGDAESASIYQAQVEIMTQEKTSPGVIQASATVIR
ncbi:tetratricopeptide repeat protein [Planctomicrobium sp. SH527]|uniref:tetratricopeptide repeat protein n=1 Tax=Planctomicrobium sp. SH527 TaxID=3448123 RepID=UPI003F5CB02A